MGAFTNTISLLSLATAALAAPLTSSNSANALFQRSNEICKADSKCIPFTIEASWGAVDATGAGSRGVSHFPKPKGVAILVAYTNSETGDFDKWFIPRTCTSHEGWRVC